MPIFEITFPYLVSQSRLFAFLCLGVFLWLSLYLCVCLFNGVCVYYQRSWALEPYWLRRRCWIIDINVTVNSVQCCSELSVWLCAYCVILSLLYTNAFVYSLLIVRAERQASGQKTLTFSIKLQPVTCPLAFVLQTWMIPQVRTLVEEKCFITFVSDQACSVLSGEQ